MHKPRCRKIGLTRSEAVQLAIIVVVGLIATIIGVVIGVATSWHD